MKNIEEKKRAISVRTTIETIKEGKFSTIEISEMRRVVGETLAEIILRDLPSKVGEFAHNEYKEIKKNRYKGEIWDENDATDWANEVLESSSERTSEFNIGRS